MFKRFLSASLAVLSAASAGACASPAPRYPVVMDPLGSALAEAAPAAGPGEPLAEASALEPVAMASAPPATEVETPRAAPIGRVEAVTLADLPAPQTAPPPDAPAAAPLPQAAPRADATLSHVVGAGDTFYAVARRYGVGPQAVAEVNGLNFGDTLRLGQRLQLPVGARDRGPEAARAAPTLSAQSASAPIPQAQAQPAPVPAAPVRSTVIEPQAPVVAPAPIRLAPTPAPVVVPPVAAPSVPAARPVTPVPSGAAEAAAPAIPGQGVFAWPLRGDILSGFGPKGVGQRNDGVRIAAAEGDPVRASAAGTVVYAGDQVKGGFGKLVLIEHEGRWFTAYAHLSDITVRMRQTVTQSQQIGRAGRTGDVGAPQLYFEVRHAPTAADRARPVDPVPLLPQ